MTIKWRQAGLVLMAGFMSIGARCADPAGHRSLDNTGQGANEVPERAAQAGAPGLATGRLADEEALIAHAKEPWFGDLDGMFERGFVRMLTVYSPLFFHYDGAEKKGLTYEFAVAFEKTLNEARKKNQPQIRVLMIPVPRDRLFTGLNDGLGDIAAANLTVTPRRQKQVQFSDPGHRGVTELVVTHADGPRISSLDDLVDLGVSIRKSSSYYEHLSALNRERKRARKKPVPIRLMDEWLEDYDLLEMVNARMLPAVVVDSYKADFWAKVFDNLVINEDVTVNTGGSIAWAMRKDSPQLLEAVNRFSEQARVGTRLGNIVVNRYYRNTKWVERALSDDGMARHQGTIELIKTYADRYDFDWAMILAQAYQESKLDQRQISPVGAIGVMQVMPATAADPIVDIPDITDEEQNIHAGVKYLRFLRDRHFNAPEISPLDQVLFSLAAYNAGPGAISRARSRAEKMGLDRNVWFGHVEVAAAAAISREPVIYVRNIYKYYVAYKLLEARRAELDKAKGKSN